MKQKHKFTAAWRWPAEIEQEIKERISGDVLNLCSGKSPLGDISADRDRSHYPDIQADMRNLPFRTGAFDSVIFDPPWKIQYFKRMKPLYEAIRVCKSGGIIVFNAKWVGESDRTTVEEVWVRADDPWADISTIVIHRKDWGQTTFKRWSA